MSRPATRTPIHSLLLSGREDDLRERTMTTHRAQFRRLLEECERYRGEALPAEHPDASITYFGPAAANLALAYRLTGQGHYLVELRRWLTVAVSFEHWGKAHMPDTDLDAGWLLHGLGLAYSWAGSALPEEELVALRDKLALQGDRLYAYAVESEGGWWSSSYWQNHNWICYAGLATAGYALLGEHAPALQWTERSKANFDTVLDLLSADGSNHEGVVYWRYGEPWLASYLDILRDAEGIDWFPRSAHLAETFWFRLYQSAPDLQRIVNHGDCHDLRSGHSVALYYKLAAEYRIPQARWLADRVAEDFYWREAYESGVKPGIRAEAYQELLWFDPEVPPVAPDTLPTSRFFPDLGLLSARTSWCADATLLSFKASPGGGHTAWDASRRIAADTGWSTLNAGHHHPDAGSFVMMGGGESLAIDEGYSSLKLTEHHNAILVDGHGFSGEGRYDVYQGMDAAHTAGILASTLSGGWAHSTSETGGMFDPALGVERVRRSIVMSPRGTVVVVDDLIADEPRRWSWLLQTRYPAVAVATVATAAPAGAAGAAAAAGSAGSAGSTAWHAPAGAAALRITALDPVRTLHETYPTTVSANPTASTPGLEIVTTQHTLRRSTAPTRTARFVTVLESMPWGGVVASAVDLVVYPGAEPQHDEYVVTIEGDGVREEVCIRFDGEETISAPPDAVRGAGFAGRTQTLATGEER